MIVIFYKKVLIKKVITAYLLGYYLFKLSMKERIDRRRPLYRFDINIGTNCHTI